MSVETTRREGVVTQGNARFGSLLAWGAIVGVAVFVLGWIVAGALEGNGYSAVGDDISDLAAVTAHHATLMLVAQGVCSALVIAFALLALRPALSVPGRRGAVGPWLLAGSLIALDNLSDVFFRLDCRAADSGCTMSVATASSQGKVHVAVAILAAVMTAATPFVLSRRMRSVVGWQDLAKPAFRFGLVLVAMLVATAALEESSIGGLVQRTAAVLVSAGVVVLALRTIRVERSRTLDPSEPAPTP